MKTFEYGILQSFGNNYEFKYVTSQKTKKFEYLEHALYELGQEGWELCCFNKFIINNDEIEEWFFKRELCKVHNHNTGSR